MGFTIGDRENRQAWEDLLDDLRARGVKEIGLWITDGNQAMINALEAKFPDSPRQRCVKHTPALPPGRRDGVAGGAREMDNL